MIPMQAKLAPGLAQVFDFTAKTGLGLADLIEVGGEDLESSNPRKVEKAKRVEKCWSLMAKLGVKYADLENSPLRTSRAAGDVARATFHKPLKTLKFPARTSYLRNPMKSMT
jgi:hypothetical protein